MAPCMERLWVKVPDQCGLLPFLWNFRVQLIDIGSRTPGAVLFPDTPDSNGLHSLGLMWLEALLSNQRQGVGRVHDALRQAAETCPADDARFVDRFFRGKRDPSFLPDNIFWEPEGKFIDDTWNPLWEKALGLGLDLLSGSRRPGLEWSAEAFQGSVESVRSEVREALFPVSLANVRQVEWARTQEAIEPSEALRRPKDEDETIRGILRRIHATWKEGAESQRKEPSEELEKTQFFSSGGTRQPPEPRLPDETERGEEVFVETVILSAAGAAGGSTSSPAPTLSSAEEPSPEEQGEQEGKPAVPVEAEGLEKTVFLDPSRLRGKGRHGTKK